MEIEKKQQKTAEKQQNRIVWHTEKRKIKDLIPTEGNPRKLTEKEARDLEASLKKFNLADIPVINLDNRIISGHQRIAILKKLGREDEEIDVRVPNRMLTDEEHREYLLRANKNIGEWDYDLLANFDEELLKEVGWESEELDKIFELETSEDDFNADEEYQKIEEPKTKYGDIYQLGNHRLMCGDSTKREDVEKLMNGEKADMVFTDPPYNIGLDYSKRLGGKRTTNKKVFSDKKSESEYKEFISKAIKNSLEIVKNDTHIFWWCDESYIYLFQQLFLENGIKPRRVNLWIKNNFNPTPQIAFNKVYEPCIYGTIGNPKLNKEIKNLTEILNKDLQKVDDVYEYIFQGINLWLENRENVFRYEHTTQKPITLAEKPIKRCTERNDIVLDLFGGSGSTLIAAEQLNRRCYIMELDPKYCDVIIQRWEKLTGKKAEKVL